MKKSWKTEAIILTIGLIVAGYVLRSAVPNNRSVTVKGLAEQEVKANQVIWNFEYVRVGNDLSLLYKEMARINQQIQSHLKAKQLSEKEISINAPTVEDREARQYSYNEKRRFRYRLVAGFTIKTEQVDLVRHLIAHQLELFPEGVVPNDNYQTGANYKFTRLNEIKPEMIEKATKNARAAALKFAKDSESKLGKIKYANQGQFTITNRDQNTPYLKKVRVVTTVQYMLED
jgi:hypothetical protein